MKIFKTFFFGIILLLFIGCKGEESKEVTITGKIKGELPEKVEYTLPSEGAFIYEFKKSVKPDSLGQFSIKMELQETAFVKLMIREKLNITIVAEPHKNYEVNFDLTKEDSPPKYEIHCETKSAQHLYNKLPNPSHIQVAARPFFKDSVASLIKSKIDDLKTKDLSKFNDLLAKDSISQSMYDFIKLDRDYYYSGIQGTVAFIKFLQNERQEGLFTEDIKQMWEETFKNNLLTRPDFQKTLWGNALAENYLFYKGYEEVSFDIDEFKKLNTNTFYTKKVFQDAEKYLENHILESFKAVYLYTELFQKNYQKEFVSIYENFKTYYPKSVYIQYLEPMIAPVITFNDKAKQPFSKDVNFVSNHENMNNFDDVLSHFRGKKLYVDVWATWCGPCKKEFKHKDNLHKVLKEKDVELLYISIDREEKKQQWKDMIKFYNLEGNHIITNKKLSENLREIYGKSGSLSIPWYILVDENGAIVKKHAVRPSKLEKLKEELTLLN
ncbi:TlpA family protein disulfide reductase [Flavivirga spongiicola]|uniref:TlpA family protein disulfide reductase n=1 Tax=Flavivirga spongiicola TaxID=421621 RepID=A0ABU7XTF7_9FLAO|nr:TlpA disulfide reductase family protein [Flavivirga sp. MEBiC05379]MDO5979075.1 TlpA disulfide reductase family protein [Flavivirga sp. MEBiC05379]